MKIDKTTTVTGGGLFTLDLTGAELEALFTVEPQWLEAAVAPNTVSIQTLHVGDFLEPDPEDPYLFYGRTSSTFGLGGAPPYIDGYPVGGLSPVAFVPGPFPVSYIPFMTRFGITGITTTGMGYSNLGFRVDVEVSYPNGAPEIGFAGEYIFGVLSPGQMVMGNSGSNMEVSWFLPSSGFKSFSFPGSYDLSATPHTYSIERVGNLVTYYYDNSSVGTLALTSGDVINSTPNDVSRLFTGGNYQLHSIGVEVDSILRFEVGPQATEGFTWFDTSGNNNHVTWTVDPGVITDPVWTET